MLLGDKIVYYRKQKVFTQDELGKGICAGSYISKFEKNKLTPNKELLDQIRSKLGISGVPLNKEELDEFKEELKEWHYYIKSRLYENALSEQPKIEYKANASLEPDFIIMYKIYYFKLLLGLWRFEEAKFVMDWLIEKNNELYGENKYFLYYYSGVFYAFTGVAKKAMDFYKKAQKMECEVNIYDSGLYYAICNLYSRTDYIFKTLYYANKTIEISNKNSEKNYITETEIILAINYSKIGEHRLAEEIYKGCLPQVLRENNKSLTNIIYHNLACVYAKMKCYEKAFAYFDLAAEQLKKETDMYILLDIAYTMLDMGNKNEAIKKAEKGLLLAKKVNNDTMEFLFEMIIHTNKLENMASLEYVEETGIPKLINEGMYLKAIEYCNFLSVFYEDKNTKTSLKKALKYSRLLDRLYKKIIEGDEMI